MSPRVSLYPSCRKKKKKKTFLPRKGVHIISFEVRQMTVLVHHNNIIITL